MNKTLYQLTEEHQELLAMLEEEELDETKEQAIKETLAMIAMDIADKAEGYCMVLKQLQADAEAVKAEKLRLAKRQSSIENGIERLREALKHSMLITGHTKIKTPLFTLNTSSRWKAFLDVPEDQIPEEFQKVTIKADMKAIEEWLKKDQCTNAQECEWARLEQVENLTIR